MFKLLATFLVLISGFSSTKFKTATSIAGVLAVCGAPFKSLFGSKLPLSDNLLWVLEIVRASGTLLFGKRS